jgi:hypothetical protein
MALQELPASTWRTRAAFWWLLLSALAVAVFAPLPYALNSLTDLGDGPGVAANYVDRATAVQVAFFLHVGFGGLALLLSPFQFATRLRTRAPHVHRATGRVVLVSIAVAGTAGLVLAPHSLAGAVGTAGFGLLALLWLTFAATAFRAIRRRDVAGVDGQVAFDRAYVLVPFLSWVPNLLVAERYLATSRAEVARA